MNSRGTSERIAKNTLMLYIRQIAIMLINLYLVRKVLFVLGDVDYGIYTLVAGIATMFNVLSGSMSQACQRFFSVDLGKKDYHNLNKTISASLITYLIVGLITVILTETAGLWYVLNYLTLPTGRENVAYFVYQTSIISLLFTILSTPFMALVLACEDMNIYAVISIVEAILKLIFVSILKYLNFDKLIIYSIMLMCVSIIVFLSYVLVCKERYKWVKLAKCNDNKIYKEIISFAGWNFFGALIYPLKIQGLNIVLNQFFGTLVITARGIATSVNSAVTSFSFNFGNALRPQIVKKYASGNEDASLKIVYTGSKITYLLMFAVVYPFIMEMDTVLKLWLGKVPSYAVIFAQLTLIDALIESVSNPLMALVDATGNIKKYQLVVGGLQLLNLPLTYFAILIKPSPIDAYLVAIGIAMCTFIARTKILAGLTKFSALDFYVKVVLRVVLASIAPAMIIFIIRRNLELNIIKIIVIYIIFELITILSFWLLALNAVEKSIIRSLLEQKFKR